MTRKEEENTSEDEVEEGSDIEEVIVFFVFKVNHFLLKLNRGTNVVLE